MKKNRASLVDTSLLKGEEYFHDQWAKGIQLDDLCIIEAFEGIVTPEYRFAFSLLGDVRGKKVLNPGCGAGEETVYLAQKGAEVHATDLSGGMVEVTQQLVKKMGVDKQVKITKMSAEELTFKDSTFDLIFGNSIIHHTVLNRSVKEFARVLKPGGKAVFMEPLSYNPLINLYRKMASIVRTPHEHPLTYKDIEYFKKHFSQVNHYEFQFFTLLIFCYFYLVQKVHPNQDRYWKKIIREGEKYKTAFQVLYFMDRVVLSVFPFLRRLCWITVVEAVK